MNTPPPVVSSFAPLLPHPPSGLGESLPFKSCLSSPILLICLPLPQLHFFVIICSMLQEYLPSPVCSFISLPLPQYHLSSSCQKWSLPTRIPRGSLPPQMVNLVMFLPTHPSPFLLLYTPPSTSCILDFPPLAISLFPLVLSFPNPLLPKKVSISAPPPPPHQLFGV